MSPELKYVLAPVFRWVGLGVLLGALAFAADREMFLQHAQPVQGLVTATHTEPRACDDGGRGRRATPASIAASGCLAYFADIAAPQGATGALLVGVGRRPPAEYTQLHPGAHLDVLVETGAHHRVLRNAWGPLWGLPVALAAVGLALLGAWFAFSRPPPED
jgi:hypothetical protein